MFNRQKKEKDINLLAILLEGGLIIAIGIILCFLPIKNEKISNIAFTLGQLFISVAAGSLLLEWFGYVKYIKKRMCEILSENEVLNVLSIERKKELKTAILNNLYMPNKALGENNIVAIIDSEMDNILKDYYYSEYIMYVDIRVEEVDQKKYIKKTIRKTYCAETINNKQCSIEQLLHTQINPVLGEKTVELNELIINGVKQSHVKVEMKDNMEDDANHYEKIFFADISSVVDKLKFSDKVSVDMTYTTYTEMSDTVFSHQINKPCKHYCIHFNYSSNITLDLVGFGFMTNGNDDKKRIVKTLNGHMLRFLSWILPGDGVMAALTIDER